MPPPALLFPQTANINGAVRLEGGKCVVRDWARTDKEAVLKHANNTNVWRNLGHLFPHPYTGDDAERWFAHLEAMPEPSHWAIEVERQAVGGVGVILGEGLVRLESPVFAWNLASMRARLAQ
jgi:hypothetical protein